MMDVFFSNDFERQNVNQKKPRRSAESDDISENRRMTLSWSGIEVTSPEKGRCGKKRAEARILKGVSGIVHPGKLMAVMGASGSGKTSLLHALTFRNMAGLEAKGDVRINGHVMTRKVMGAVSAFVPQNDVFFGTLTVREHLYFHATLRMKGASLAQRNRRIDHIIDDMGLNKCEHTLIGITDRMKGISGGERKRLSFATEVINHSVLIFCDEPTSGLDSFMARNLMLQLEKYASRGRTILCTIHQPSSEIFELFNDICLLCNGECVFIGKSSDCAKIFASAGHPCPVNFNPSDHYIWTLSMVPGRQEESLQKIESVAKIFAASDEAKLIRDEIDQVTAQPLTSEFIAEAEKDKLGCGGSTKHFFLQCQLLYCRQMKNMFRFPSAFFVRFVTVLVVAILVGCLFFRINFKSSSSQRNAIGVLFYIALLSVAISMNLLIIAIPNDIQVVQRDYLSGLYSMPTYYLNVAIFFTIEVMATILSVGTIVFWLSLFDAPVKLGSMYASVIIIIVLGGLVGIAVGLFFSSMTSSFQVASSFSGPFFTICALFSSVFIPKSQIPGVFIVFMYINPVYYLMELLTVALYKNMAPQCIPHFVNNSHSLVDMKRALLKRKYLVDEVRNEILDYCKPPPAPSCDNYSTGRQVLEIFSFIDDKTRDYLILVALASIFHIFGITILSLRMRLKRR